MTPSNRATISDIAEAAGVSKATVSRFINGRLDLMSKPTAERIRLAIEQLEYKPSDAARSLKTKKTNLIGVLVADMTSPFSTAVIVSAGDYLSQRGYSPLVADCNNDPEKEREFAKAFQLKGVAGLIVNTTSSHNDYLASMAEKGMPVVLCDRSIEAARLDLVTVENGQIMQQLISHLKEQGFTRPVYFTQRWEHNSTRSARRRAFIESVKSVYGYDPGQDIFVVNDGEQNPLSRLKELRRRLRPEERAAVVCVNSVTTIRTYRAMRTLELDIPGDMGLCGPEDWNWKNEMNWSLLVEPNITTFLLPAREIGRRCAELIVEKIENPAAPPREIFLTCELTARESTLRRGAGKPKT